MPDVKDLNKIRMDAIEDFVRIFDDYLHPHGRIVCFLRSVRILSDEPHRRTD